MHHIIYRHYMSKLVRGDLKVNIFQISLHHTKFHHDPATFGIIVYVLHDLWVNPLNPEFSSLIVLNIQQINYKFNRQIVAWWFLFLMT